MFEAETQAGGLLSASANATRLRGMVIWLFLA